MADFSQIPWARAQQVDFSTLGDLGKTFREARVTGAREAELSKLDPNNPQSVQAMGLALLKAGDIQGATTLANLGNQQEQLGLERRRVGLAERQAEEKPQYQVLEDPSGGKRLVKIEPYGRGFTDVTPKEFGGGTSNPFSMGKMTDTQSKDALYTSRMMQSEKILRGVEQAGTSVWERFKGGLSNRVGVNVRGDEYQKFDQAQRDFINAVLRRESGAVIADSEFDNATKQYFPAPGDTAEVIAQKRANRMEAIRGIGAGAGPNFKPPAGTEGLLQQQAPGATQPAASSGRVAAPAVPSGLMFNPNAMAGGATAQAAPQGGPVRIGSAQERDALPPGTPYIAPDGSLRTKQ